MVYVKKDTEDYRRDNIQKMKAVYTHLLNELFHQPMEDPQAILAKLEIMQSCVKIWIRL